VSQYEAILKKLNSKQMADVNAEIPEHGSNSNAATSARTFSESAMIFIRLSAHL
jgi:hypothetical protein